MRGIHIMEMAALLLAVAVSSRNVSAFGSPQLQLSLQPRPQLQQRHPPIFSLNQSTQEEQEEGGEYELVEFSVSAAQISFLRKEASKRESRKNLPKFFLPPDESTDISEESVGGISNLFDTSELVEIRGVSRDEKKHVFDTAHGLAAVLEDAFGKPVVVVDIKGFAVKLYCPWDNDERGTRMQLRTSYKPGQWTRKAKPVRDERGQIVIGDDGKSVKEIPEY